MRLPTDQIHAIRTAAASVAGPSARVWVFGSRVDNSAHGGDVVVKAPNLHRLPIHTIAMREGVLL